MAIGIWADLRREVRNLGHPGICAMAISAVDGALWDLKARLLGVPLVTLLGAVRDGVPVYGSGGFTSYPVARLQEQLAHWVDAGIRRVKMSGRTAGRRSTPRARGPRTSGQTRAVRRRERRVQPQRRAGDGRALHRGCHGSRSGPVRRSRGLRLLRDRAPAGMDIAAEYGPSWWTSAALWRPAPSMCSSRRHAATDHRLHRVEALCERDPSSAHGAIVFCCALAVVRHVSTSTTVRIERAFFDGAPGPRDGVLRPICAPRLQSSCGGPMSATRLPALRQAPDCHAPLPPDRRLRRDRRRPYG